MAKAKLKPKPKRVVVRRCSRCDRGGWAEPPAKSGTWGVWFCSEGCARDTGPRHWDAKTRWPGGEPLWTPPAPIPEPDWIAETLRWQGRA